VTDDKAQPSAGAGYPQDQLATAFVTALTHEDPATQQRAEERLSRWRQVLAGMADHRLAIGSRTPVAGFPAWVTPQVVRGGFATGAAAAGGPLAPHETEFVRRASVPADRRVLFCHHLTDAGIAELDALLDSGRYEIAVPEQAALLTVAWLLRAGDRLAAPAVLEEIQPFAGRLDFAPRPTDMPPPDGPLVHRRRRGVPGSPRHAAVRHRQAADAARPTYHALAQLLVARLTMLPSEAGLPGTGELTAPVTEAEAARTRVPAGTPIPEVLRRVVDRALSAPVTVLVERGISPLRRSWPNSSLSWWPPRWPWPTTTPRCARSWPRSTERSPSGGRCCCSTSSTRCGPRTALGAGRDAVPADVGRRHRPRTRHFGPAQRTESWPQTSSRAPSPASSCGPPKAPAAC
jgi:hypothetical protein